jgi:sugar/nucleoside kinase (ribokinase family)
MFKPNIVIVGHLSLDNYLVNCKKTAKFEIPAGNALGSVAGALLWEQSIGIVSRAGFDYPSKVFSTLRSKDVSLQGIHKLECPSIRFWILQEDNQPSQIAIPFGHVDFDNLSPLTSDIPTIYKDVKGVHIAPMPIERQKQFAEYFSDCDTVVSLDPLPPYYHGNPDKHREILLDILPMIDIFMPGRPELDALFPGLSRPEIVSRCFNHGVKLMIVRDGENGSFIYTSTNLGGTKIPVVPVQVLETSGAGDAYCGGFIAEYIQSRDEIESALKGAVSASFMLEQWGRLDYVDAYTKAYERLQNIRDLFNQNLQQAA